MRVMYSLWAEKCVKGMSWVLSYACMSCQTKTFPFEGQHYSYTRFKIASRAGACIRHC